ncbi:MAG: hypothetical protein EVG15_07620 [Candidatus Acididesulfobacter diazotrophicus]|jgi:hypothetical protein|uniref:Uncharacterized protein n=1 Tax=Candidatus Acididesulfobacter diazotrophicus TaxID=2597226 RepID=A0A519BLE6_9DELT|nr:MAG: hypothetical protein EVG15_07620 [Candidatus Acididesulfobacter diazotrophicus]
MENKNITANYKEKRIYPIDVGLESLFWSCPDTPVPVDTIITAAIKSTVFEYIVLCVEKWGIDRVMKNYNEIRNYIKKSNLSFLDFQFKIIKEVFDEHR